MILTKAKPVLTGADELAFAASMPTLALKKIFYQGFLTNVLNPKVALFFLAFVPQFISLDAPNKALAFIFLGVIFNVNGQIWCQFLAWSSASISRAVKRSDSVNLWLTRLMGGVFGYFGVKLAMAQQG